MPRRFPRFTDAGGCRWGLDREGAISLSGSALHPALPLFRQAAQLTVNHEAFAPLSASASPDFSRLRLTGTAGAVPVIRDIWVDRERGAVRYCDTLSNPSDQPARLLVAHSVVFDQPVTAIHRLDGAEIDERKTETRLGVAAFLQNQPEGMSSALFLLGDPTGKVLPVWKGKKSSEQHDFEWSLEAPAQGAVSLVTWVAQRPALAPGDIRSLAAAYFKNGRLLRPQLDPSVAATLANFPAKGLSGDGGATDPPDAGQLLAPLARFAERLGIGQGKEDVYYMNAKSLLEGKASGAPLTLQSRFGPLTVPLAEVAAVQGAGGGGRWPRVFLRDGHVLSGALTLPEWKITGSKGWAIALHADTLEALVLRTGPPDGAAAPAPAFLARLASGETLPLRIAPEERLAFVTPWGPLEVAAADLTGLWRLRLPSPSVRLTLRDGSRLTVFPSPGELTAASARLGTVTLQATDLAALWPATSEAPDPEAIPEEITSLEELGAGGGPLALLRGSNILSATLVGPTLTLVASSTETELSTADLHTLQRAEGSSDAAPFFVLTLTSGAIFEGSLRGGTLALDTRGGPRLTVPLSHLLAWTQGENQPPAPR